MSVYVLIWVIGTSGGGVTSGSAYFSTAAACEAAARAFTVETAASGAFCTHDPLPEEGQ